MHLKTEPASPVLGVRIASIDILRGFAILAVIAVHSREPWSAALPRWLSYGAFGGRYGVDLFFILSAFLLIGGTSKTSVNKFFVRRWLRIAPLYYFGIIVYGVIPWALGWDSAPSMQSFAANLFFLNSWIPGRVDTVVPGGWSISVEAIFYILLPCAARIVTTARRAYAVWLLSLIFSLLAARLITTGFLEHHGSETQVNIYLHYYPISQMPTFALGFILYFILPTVDRNRQWLWVILLIGAGIITVNCSQWITLPRTIAGGIPMFSIALATCIWVTEPTSVMLGLLRRLGVLSYSIYLMHFWVLSCTELLVIATLVPRGASSVTMFLTTFSLTVLLSAAVALICHRYIEMPAYTLMKGRSKQAMSLHKEEFGQTPTGATSLFARWPFDRKPKS